MKATSLLEEQHRTVEALFEKLKRGQGDPVATLRVLANNLIAHMVIEQDLFYPAIKGVDAERVSENFEEHALVELALSRLRATDTSDPAFKARVTALEKVVEHHVMEEEEELFPLVEESLSEDALIQLGKAMRGRFAEVVEMGFEAAVPKGGVPKTSADVAQKAQSRRTAKKDKTISA